MTAGLDLYLGSFVPYLLAGLLGACVGSFANVLIYRLPRNRSIVRPRSFCPSCQATVSWYDNIPLLSWLLLTGSCRRCGTAISWQYPVVEFLGAACALLAVWRFGFTWTGLSAFLFLVNLLVIARIDWEHMIIPHTLTIGGMVAGLALSPWNGVGLGQALLGGLAGAGIVIVLSWGYKLVRGQLGMGGGDVMLLGMVGIYLGVRGVGLVLFGGAILGSIYALVRFRGRLSGQNRLPFGTFLAGAAVVALLAGDIVVSWYLAFLI